MVRTVDLYTGKCRSRKGQAERFEKIDEEKNRSMNQRILQGVAKCDPFVNIYTG
jgi:hypothetical protein